MFRQLRKTSLKLTLPNLPGAGFGSTSCFIRFVTGTVPCMSSPPELRGGMLLDSAGVSDSQAVRTVCTAGHGDCHMICTVLVIGPNLGLDF